MLFRVTKHLNLGNLLVISFSRRMATTVTNGKKGIVIGSFCEKGAEKKSYTLTKAAESFDSKCSGAIKKTIDILGPISKGKSRLLFNISPNYDVVSVVGLGSQNASYNELEEVEEGRENIRAGIAAGVRSIREASSDPYSIDIDDCNDPEAAAEGSHLCVYYFDELKNESLKKKAVQINLLNENKDASAKWDRGVILAKGQNIVRRLMEMPANLMTPTIFAKNASFLTKNTEIKLTIHDKKWAEDMKMGSYLSVSNGSDEPPVFLELHYNNNAESKPVVFVGKGITFDSGGISLKPSLNMDKMRADMGGAANVLGTIVTLASLGAKVNIIGLIPLTENLPNGKATKPGDVVTSMSGKTIQVDNTDAEGRLVLCDGITYGQTFDPILLMDIATLTGAIGVALGSAAAGAYSTSSQYWELLKKSGSSSGDRVWRMPLFNHYTKCMTENSPLADINNIGGAGKGGSCCAAAFLREFVKCPNWIHLDIAGVMETKDDVPYLSKGMSGRPLRTLVQFLTSVTK